MGRAVRKLLRLVFYAVVAFYAVCIAGLLYLKLFPPLFTTVQIQRQVEALGEAEEYDRRYDYVPLGQISDQLEHAVVAAEDTRFYQHSGFDWEEMENAWEEASREGRGPRGASTITQQLVKNLFLTTHRSYPRKALEYTLTPLAELILSKERILELYLNVAEWGPGIFGAEAAAEYHYDRSAAELTREQASRLAAILPAPRTRKPRNMDSYSRIIRQRMNQMGW